MGQNWSNGTVGKWELVNWELVKWESSQMGVGKVGVDQMGVGQMVPNPVLLLSSMKPVQLLVQFKHV